MYRPPQNTNRVKSIKNKFENIDNKSPERNNGHRNNLKVSSSPKKTENIVQSEKLVVQRQLSDPCRRNIKRTPAFRLDKSVDRSSGFQRNGFNRSTLFESKVKQYSAVKNCDNVSSVVSEVPRKPLMVKSKSSHDFNYIRSKFDKVVSDNNAESQSKCSESDNLQGVDLSLLYTEPIPKSLRNKNIEHSSKPHLKGDSIYNKSTLKLSDKQPYTTEDSEKLTDTLKTALKKPLPAGPAPKKPPRTFQHTINLDNLEKNISFLHVERKSNSAKPKVSPKKADPKYMLNKLETALRNNKLRARRQVKTDISTSGEDSDDSLLFRSKSNRTLPKLPSHDTENTMSAFNFNCLNSLGCSVVTYEKIREPNSSFFIDKTDEPLYSEPYHYLKESLDLELRKREDSVSSKGTSKSLRNSLYYMSTPVLNGNVGGARSVVMDATVSGGSSTQQDEAKTSEMKLNESYQLQPPSAENSSLSSFTSDLDSTPSPMDESSKIRNLIDNYESKSVSDQPIDSSYRVEQLKNSLRKTLERSFTCDSAVRDSDSENNEAEMKVSNIVKKFETYRQGMPKYCKSKMHKDSLFFCCLIIEKVRDCARVKFKYPAHVEVPENLESLCFPESGDTSMPLDAMNTTQTYSLLITNDKGERMFGYCRRVLPEGSTHCLPLAYCILSKYRAPRFYKRILVELESRHGMQYKTRDELIRQFYNQNFPKPGESIHINLTNIEGKSSTTDDLEPLESFFGMSGTLYSNDEGNCTTSVNESDTRRRCTVSVPNYIRRTKEKTELILTLHPDSRYEDCDLKSLHQLPADVLLKIFSSLLLERKVILISSAIGKLSSCVDSLQSILYPFTWHHTFIPILPQQLWDIVETPTPVICGVMSDQVVEDHQVENGIVVNLDTGVVIKEEGDENKILSGSMQKMWRRSLALANKASSSVDYVHSMYLSDAYLQVFIMVFKGYKRYFVNGEFQKDEFIRNGKTRGIRRFLNMFTETNMFQAFVDTVLLNPEDLADFDKKIEMYGSEESSVILDKLLEWGRKSTSKV